ncbi:helix-turn-helix domain-containing protein [Kitasatospora sp. NPDC088134]|uniref:helix-turn-helix domain-containing protein n=1 Tax=Kitasatospora sp. NPDC088134 TaxID=3364071 RepID=UPI00381ECADC
MLPNEMLQRADLSLTAHGVLGYLLSRPDGWQETARDLAKRFKDSLGSIYRALRELTAAGYYHVVKTRLPDGRVISVQHVHDTPRTAPAPASAPDPAPASAPAPDDGPPETGTPESGPRAPLKTKEPEKETTPRPPLPPEQPRPRPRPKPRPPLDDRTRHAATLLLRVVRPEPRLRIGQAEAERLAPLVLQWLDHGSTPHDLAAALLPGLPTPVHSPPAFIDRRLRDKLPPAPTPHTPPPTCDDCRVPVPRPGRCTPCADQPPHPDRTDPRPGPTRAREALRAAREALRHRATT